MTPDIDLGHDSPETLLGERIRQGDRSAEKLLFDLYSARIYAMAQVRLRDRELARELVDDVMMAVIAALRRGAVRDPERVGAFVHGTTMNLIRNRHRDRARRPLHESIIDEPAAPDTYEQLERDSDVDFVRRCLGQLPAQDSQVLLLSVVDGLTPGEIAARLGLSSERVRQQKSRALKRLKNLLGPPSRCPGQEPL